MSMPGTLPENEKRDFAIWNDITATILGAAGAKMKECQGFDLFNTLKKGNKSPRKCAVATLYKAAAVATKNWKLTYYFEEGDGMLFDRINDHKEQNNLFKNSDYDRLKNELIKALLTWRADLENVNKLIKRTGGGGPVAQRVGRHTKKMKGCDFERRLNKKVEEIDLKFKVSEFSK